MLSSRQRPVWSLAALAMVLGAVFRAAPWCAPMTPMCKAQGCRQPWAASGKTQNARISKFIGLGPFGPVLGPNSRGLRFLLAQNHETLVDALPILQRLVEQKEAATLVQIPGEDLKSVWFPPPFRYCDSMGHIGQLTAD